MTEETLAEDTPKKGRSNAIITYATIEEMNLSLQRTELTVVAIRDDIKDINRVRDDHDVRIRALELAQARQGGAFSTWGIAFLSIWPVAGFLMALLAYLNK